MTPQQLHDLFRAHVRDEAYPYLWSEVEVWAYMNDAQEQFCRLTGGIPDSTSDLCTVEYDAGDAFVDYDRRILKLRRVTRDDRCPVEIVNDEDIQFGTRRPTPREGEVHAVVIGDDQYSMFLRDIPREDGELNLHVLRLPLEEVTGPESQFEIDRQHHLHLLDWMKALAYSKQDAETYDKGKAEEFQAAFAAYCDRVRTEQGRREHKPRAVAYGGL